MTIYNVIWYLIIAGVAARVFRASGTRVSLGWTVLPLVVLALNLAWRGWHVSVDPPDAIDIIFIFLGGVLLWLWVRPPRVLLGVAGMFVARLRWGRDPRFQFDRQVHQVLRPLRPLLRAVPPLTDDPEWRQAATATREHALESLLELNAPTAEWAEVRDQYVELVRGELATTAVGPSPTDVAELRSKRAAVSARVVELRAAYGLRPRRQS